MIRTRIYNQVESENNDSTISIPIIKIHNEDLSAETIIKDLYNKQEQFDKERKLILNQLLLPVDKRNAALFRKHNINISSKGVVDNYPDNTNKLGIKYFCKCYFPMDPTISSERRVPGRNYIQVGLFNDRIGNSYKFYFPISVDNRPDNNEAGYSIDFLKTFVEDDGSYYNIDGIEYSIYSALFDNLKEDNTAKDKIEKKFREYGMIDNSGFCTYQIKNRGVVVELLVKNFNNNALKTLEFDKSDTNQAENVSENQLEGLLANTNDDYEAYSNYKEEDEDDEEEKESDDEDEYDEIDEKLVYNDTINDYNSNDSEMKRVMNTIDSFYFLNVPLQKSSLNRDIFTVDNIIKTYTLGYMPKTFSEKIKPMNIILRMEMVNNDEDDKKIEIDLGTIEYIHHRSYKSSVTSAVMQHNTKVLSEFFQAYDNNKNFKEIADHKFVPKEISKRIIDKNSSNVDKMTFLKKVN